MKKYFVNNNQTTNPGLHHEVHTEEHVNALRIADTLLLGNFNNEIAAVQRAREIYSDADGCATCCPLAHRG